MKKIIYILIVSMLAFSSCTLFDLQSRAKHTHLNKVPVNDPLIVNIHDDFAIADQEDLPVAIIEKKANKPAPDVEPAMDFSEIQRKAAPIFRSIEKKASLRHLNTAFKAQVSSKPASENQSIDIGELLIWVLIFAVILAVLSYLLPGLISLFIGLLIVVLIVMAIVYLAGAM